MNKTRAALHPMRILGVFAHPDDESFCAGGTLARYAALGAEVMVVSATRGEAGQIRSAGVATRRTLGQVRAQELALACQRLGVQHAVCLDYGDGRLQEVDQDILIGEIVQIIRSFQPEVVITFGPDGGYGHPDHMAVSAATTAACVRSGESHYASSHLAAGLAPHRPAHLLYSHFPHKRQLLLEQIAHWHVQTRRGFQGTWEFAYALLLLCEEATLLHYSRDHVDVAWYPAGCAIVEQGERASSLYLLLSGTARVIREGVDGTHQVLAYLQPGAFFGQEGLVSRQTCHAHVIAQQHVTCLVLSPEAPTAFLERGADAHISSSTGGEEQDMEQVLKETICIQVDPNLRQKVEAIAAHRSQFPIQPAMLPLAIWQALLGQEYFVPVSLVSGVELEFLAWQEAA